jgi:hypothetical protein
LIGAGIEAWPTPRDPAAAAIFDGRMRVTA